MAANVLVIQPSPVTSHQSPAELQTKVREDFTIMEKTPTMAFSWFKAPTTLSHLRHLRHFATLTLTPLYTGAVIIRDDGYKTLC